MPATEAMASSTQLCCFAMSASNAARICSTRPHLRNHTRSARRKTSGTPRGGDQGSNKEAEEEEGGGLLV
eukprot:COSAG02_NODE_36091_length_459_cov_0.763889_1_plen_69_part_10